MWVMIGWCGSVVVVMVMGVAVVAACAVVAGVSDGVVLCASRIPQ